MTTIAMEFDWAGDRVVAALPVGGSHDDFLKAVEEGATHIAFEPDDASTEMSIFEGTIGDAESDVDDDVESIVKARLAGAFAGAPAMGWREADAIVDFAAAVHAAGYRLAA